MSIFFSVSEWFEQDGAETAAFQAGLRDAIAQHTCNIWSQFPRFFTNSQDPTRSWIRGALNQACANVAPTPQIEPPPFTGGQCCDLPYIVLVEWEFIQCNGNVANAGTANPTITGRITGMTLDQEGSNPNQRVLNINFVECDNTPGRVPVTSFTQPSFESCTVGNPPAAQPSDIDLGRSSFGIVSITPVGGGADPCGDLPSGYPPESPPTINDLSTTIVVKNVDNVDNTFELTYNQISSEYNFPIGYLINGVAVTVDVGGITIHGEPSYTTPSGNNSPPEPGSRGGREPDGTPYIQRFPTTGQSILPDLVSPETIPEELEELICNDGVIETINRTIDSVPGNRQIGDLLSGALNRLVQDICEMETEVPELGFPETYGLIPGRRRPALVIYYKEFINGERQRSTFTATVSHPSASTIASFETIVIPSRTSGRFTYSVPLTDGSRLSVSGATDGVALTALNFLLGLVDPAFIPENAVNSFVLTTRTVGAIRQLQPVQLEYYPEGKAAGVSPALFRKIDAGS